jgi:hypothetical protein
MFAENGFARFFVRENNNNLNLPRRAEPCKLPG